MINLSERLPAEPMSGHERSDDEKELWHLDSGALESATPDLSVIVPVYNEVKTIAEALRRVLEVPIKKQVVVVDDASTDGTSEMLDDLVSHHEFELIRHSRNRGKGAAIRTALAKARGKFTIIQDGDLEYDPRDYQAVIEPLMRGEADVVFGSRYATQHAFSGRNRIFRLGVGVLNIAVRALYGIRLSDEATCYKAISTEVLRTLDLECERFEFCPEVTAKICRMGLRLKEVPISYRPRSSDEGKKLRLTDGVTALRALWKWRNWQPPAKMPATTNDAVDGEPISFNDSADVHVREDSCDEKIAAPRLSKYGSWFGLADQSRILIRRHGCTISARSNWQKYNSRNPVQQYLISRFLERVYLTVDALPAKDLLDVGCGEGIVLNYLCRRLPLLNVVGIDCSSEAVAMAREGNPEVRTELGDIYRLPCLEQSSDIVMALEVLEHLEHPCQALKELRRVTRRYCLLSVPNEPWFRLGNFLRCRYMLSGGNRPEHLQRWSSRQFVRLVAKHFQIVGVWRPFPWTLVLAELPRKEKV